MSQDPKPSNKTEQPGQAANPSAPADHTQALLGLLRKHASAGDAKSVTEPAPSRTKPAG